MSDLLTQLQAAQSSLEPQFKDLRAVMSALKGAIRLASEEKTDALPMQKALTKLETAASPLDNDTLTSAVNAFAATTQTALDNLAFDFAKDLRDLFADRGETVAGRPPTLTVGPLTLTIDMSVRKAQWLYGKEPLTRPIPLSSNAILKAYDRQQKRILKRTIDVPAFATELKTAWQDCLDKRPNRRSDRANIIEVYSQLTLNRQSGRFWNAPSRSTFKDYERPFFVRDLVLLQQHYADSNQAVPFQLGVATKSQAEQASRSLWLPQTALEGQYYSDIIFE